jgi:predicted metal-binding membrane protein
VRSHAHRGWFLSLMGLLMVVLWAALWLWEQSPYGRYLEHGNWTELGIAASLCRALPGGSIVVPALLYILGWTLMTAAMMLPATLPLIDIFRRLTQRHQAARQLILLLVGGYLAAWGAFGLAAHAIGEGWLVVAHRLPWLALNGWVAGAAILGLAGFYQFTAWKDRCLDRCRTPLGFVVARWRGRAPRRDALRLGLEHGAFCVGCCWALMLLMFVVGTGSVGVMLALGAFMAAERNLPWGRRLSEPMGVALLAWAVAISADHLL